MKLREKHGLSSRQGEYSVADAIKAAVTSFDNTPGSDPADDVRRTLDNVVNALGKLVQTLHDGGRLGDDDVIDLVGAYRFEKVK